MDYQKQLITEIEHDALPDPLEAVYLAAEEQREGRFNRSQQEGTLEGDSLKRLAQDPGPERIEVERNVGELWHVRVQGSGFRVQALSPEP
jgi:hypothetical protein